MVKKGKQKENLEAPVNKNSEPITKIDPNLVDTFIKIWFGSN